MAKGELACDTTGRARPKRASAQLKGKKMTIVYALVSRQKTVLAEYTATSGTTV